MTFAARLVCFVLLIVGLALPALAAKPPAYLDAVSAGPDFRIQGEYAGTLDLPDGQQAWGVQIIALGAGKFHAVGYRGGLPGAGWDEEMKVEDDGQMKDGAAVFENAGTPDQGQRGRR